MRYLKKQADSPLSKLQLSYDRRSDRKQIRDLLLVEQNYYCAYSERYFRNTDSCEIEHFDPRKKSTPDDDCSNWYAVHAWMNAHKPKKIEPFLPLPSPSDPALIDRIHFQNGIFEPIDVSDTVASNLIDYLRWNHESLVADRSAHLEKLRFIRNQFETDLEFLEFIAIDPDNLSFVTAIEAEFGLAINTL